MMICPETFYEMRLKGKKPEQIMTVNPIGASTHCIYLERDIKSRLNRYVKDEDITDVWIWAEPAGNDCYDIYIGYA